MEALVSATIQDVLGQTMQKGDDLIHKVVEHLKNDPSWIELYNATGQLLIPSSLCVDDELKEIFAFVQKVGEGPKTNLLLISFCRN